MEIFRLKYLILYFYILNIIFSCQNKNDNKIIHYKENDNTLNDTSEVLIWNFKDNTISRGNKNIKFNYSEKGNIVLLENNKNILYYDFLTNKTYNFENQKNKYFFTPNMIKLKDSIKIEYHNKNYYIYKFHCNEHVMDGDSYHYFLKGWGIILYQIYGNEKYSNWMPFVVENSYLKVEEIIKIIEMLKNKKFLLGQMIILPPKVPEIKE